MRPIRDLSKEELQAEIRHYRFRHQVNIVSDTAKRLIKKGDELAVNMNTHEGGELEFKMKTPHLQTITELAVVLEPLLDPGSDIYYEAILEACGKANPSPELDALIGKTKEVAAKLKKGAMNLVINDKTYAPGDVYDMMMEKLVNADDIAAAAFLTKLATNPMSQEMLTFQFYDFCMNMSVFVHRLSTALKEGKHFPKEAARDELCILCKKTSTDAAFTKFEHTLPEALGNTHSILPRGYTCDPCQALLAPIEAAVANTMPFAMTKIWFTKHTKAGKFPSAQLGQVHFTKTKLNHVKIDYFAGKKSMPAVTKLPDGMVSFKLTGASKFDHIALARVLIKAALGAMTLELGRDYVLKPRFDDARAFIQTGTGLHVRLVMNKHAKPDPSMQVQWHELSNGGVGVVTQIHGIQFLFAMTPVPDETPPPDELLAEVEIFDLWNRGPTPHYKPTKPRPASGKAASNEEPGNVTK